jgi:integrase
VRPPKPVRKCWCRDPRTGREYGNACPDRDRKGRRAWYVRYSAPVTADGKRPRIWLGPYATERECSNALLDALGKIRSGRHVDDRRTKFGEYLDRRLRWWESEADIKPSTLASYREAIDLYFKPGLGHEYLVDLRDHHFRDLATAMRKINTPYADGDVSDLLRRLLTARATRDGKRISTRPLTDARIRRILAVASSALAPLAPHTLPVNPAANVRTGKARRRKPLLWTAARVERWRETSEIPAPVMVWSREHCGAFLDAIQGERLHTLFELAAYTGMRRSELAGLCWPDVDLASRRIHVRQAQVANELRSTKSEDSERIISLDKNRIESLKAWRKAQLAERLAWGAEWTDSGRVFTREDGTALRPAWISVRFDTLTARAGLPPITLHGLRHGAATWILAAGQPPKVVSEILGHSTVAFTMDVYTEVAEELADAAAEALSAYIPRAPRKPADESG